MYWSDWGEPGKIERARMDGTDRQILYDTDLVQPVGLTLDHHSNTLYWADLFYEKIEYVTWTGGFGFVTAVREILLTSRWGLVGPFSLTLSGSQVYWISKESSVVYTAHKKSALSFVPVSQNFSYELNAVEALDRSRQDTSSKWIYGSFCKLLFRCK